jgi:hypothetical protein
MMYRDSTVCPKHFVRSTTCGAAAEILIYKTVELQELLQSLSEDTTVLYECRSKACGFLIKMKS